jgi:hypothetical protein
MAGWVLMTEHDLPSQSDGAKITLKPISLRLKVKTSESYGGQYGRAKTPKH